MIINEFRFILDNGDSYLDHYREGEVNPVIHIPPIFIGAKVVKIIFICSYYN